MLSWDPTLEPKPLTVNPKNHLDTFHVTRNAHSFEAVEAGTDVQSAGWTHGQPWATANADPWIVVPLKIRCSSGFKVQGLRFRI